VKSNAGKHACEQVDRLATNHVIVLAYDNVGRQAGRQVNRSTGEQVKRV